MGPMRRGLTVFLLQAAKYVEPAFIEYYELLNLNEIVVDGSLRDWQISCFTEIYNICSQISHVTVIIVV